MAWIVLFQDRGTNAQLLTNGERQRNRIRRDVLGDAIEDVDIESLTDMISGQVFECGVNHQLVIARSPWFPRRQTPLGFLFADAHASLHAGNPKHPLH